MGVGHVRWVALNINRTKSKFGQCRPDLWPGAAQIRSMLTKFGRNRQTPYINQVSPPSGQNWPNSVQAWSNSANIFSKSTKLGGIILDLVDTDKTWWTTPQLWPSLPIFGTSRRFGFGQNNPSVVGRIRHNVCRHWSKFADIPQAWCDLVSICGFGVDLHAKQDCLGPLALIHFFTWPTTALATSMSTLRC